MPTVYSFPAEPELRRQVARLGFPDVERVVADLLPRASSSLTTAEASALVRRYAIDRPDVLPGDAFAKWTPAELRAAYRELVVERRVPEAQAFATTHKAAIATAEGVVSRERARLEERIQRAKGSAFQAEQQIGNGARGLRADLAAAEGAAWRIQQSGPPAQVAAALAPAQARVDRLKTEIASLEGVATAARGEAQQLQAEIETLK